MDVPSSPQNSVCPQCGTSNPITSRFCSQCGTELRAAQQAGSPHQTEKLPTIGTLPLSEQQPTSGPAPQPQQPAQSRNQQRLLLFGGGCAAIAVVLLCLSLITFRMMAQMLPPEPTKEPAITPSATTRPTATALPEPTIDLGATETVVARLGDLAATSAALTAIAGLPTPVPDTPEPATEEPEPSPTSRVLSEFSQAEAQELRANHDALVGGYRELLFETFDQGQRTKARWEFGDEVSRQLVNNRYEITLLEQNAYNADYWKRREGPLGDTYTAELTVRFPSLEQTTMAGIAFDIQENPDEGWLYVMTTTGEWRIYQDTRLFAYGVIPEDFEMIAEADYGLWVLRLPDQIQFFLNGVPIAVAPASAYEGGHIGVAGVSGPEESDIPYTVYVDTLLVKAP